MEMKIGTKLAQLRRDKGLTQEQLAEKLGISPPAVSKWETDTSYPDITLLCPLARALETNVDTLLQFEEQLSDKEAVEKINHIIETTLKEGYNTGEKMLSELLHKYPNSIVLKFNAALVYDSFRMFFPTAGKEIHEKWTARKKKLLLEVRSSGAASYWQTATLQLAALAISEGNLDEGELFLKELPEHKAEPAITWAHLYIKKKEPEEALKILQRTLYSVVRQAQNCLAMMTNPEIIPDNEQVLKICETIKSLDQLFGLGGQYEGMFLEVYIRMERCQDAADCLLRYADTLIQGITPPKAFLFSPGLDIKGSQSDATKELRKYLLKALEDPEYQSLTSYPAWNTAIQKLKASLM